MAQNYKNLKQEIQNNKERIAVLEERLRESLIKEEKNKKRIESLEEEIQDLKEKIKQLENENESLFIIVQLGKTTQRNMCEYVLGKSFKSWRYYKFKDIHNYIRKYVPLADQDSAKRRLKKLREEISWDQDLVDSLKNYNQTRNSKAHPTLSCEKIQQAIEFLREKGELDEQEVDNFYQLKTKWETSVALLCESSAEGHDQDRGGPRINFLTTGQKHGTFALKTTNGLVNCRPAKRARKSQ